MPSMSWEVIEFFNYYKHVEILCEHQVSSQPNLQHGDSLLLDIMSCSPHTYLMLNTHQHYTFSDSLIILSTTIWTTLSIQTLLIMLLGLY